MIRLGFGSLTALAVAAATFVLVNSANSQVVSAPHFRNAYQVTWDGSPSPEDLNALYTFAAHGQAVNASTEMRCELQADGTLANCAIMREIPTGFAFGAASIRAGKLYRARMTPDLKALVVAGGVSIIVPFTWSPSASTQAPVVTAPQFDAATLRARLSLGMAPPGRQMPSDVADLDGLLQKQDFGPLTNRLRGAHTASDVELDMNWEQTKIIQGAGFMISYAYMYDMWRLGSALPPPSGDTLKQSAGTYFLYSLALVEMDGPKCADPSAPGHRMDQLIQQNQPIVKYLMSQPPADRMMVGSLALAVEAATASLRLNDVVLCSGGAAEMSQNLQAQGDKPMQQVPNAPGTFGKSYVVPVAPGYKPEFLSADQWTPKQALARQRMPEVFTRMLSAPVAPAPTSAPK